MSFVETAMPPPADASSGVDAAPICAPAQALRLHAAADAARDGVRRLIAEIYARQFGARLTGFMPQLVSLQANGAICAAAGYRSGCRKLFLERYLSQPVECVLSAATGRSIRREEIVEVGQFVSARAGQGRRLMVALSRHLSEAGFRWAVLTATAEMRLLLRRMGLSPLTLIDADPARLGAKAAAWGSYYTHAPRVLAGDLATAIARFDQRGAT